MAHKFVYNCYYKYTWKHFYTQFQVICNARNIVTNIVVKWAGSKHDESIFYQSSIYDYMKENVREYYLVGDNGYHISRFIIVPYYQPQAGSPELA